MAKVSGEEVSKYAKTSQERRGTSRPESVKFVEFAGKANYALVSIFHTGAKSSGKWGVSFVFMRMDSPTPEFVTVDAWNADQVHRIVVDGFGWMKGYENGLPDNLLDPDYDPESSIFEDMFKIGTCADLKDKDAKWLPGVTVKRSPYVEIITEDEPYEGKSRIRAKWVNRSREIGTEGPFWVADYRGKYAAAKQSGVITEATTYFQGVYQQRVKDAQTKRLELAGARGGGGGRDSFASDDIPF